MEDQPRILNPVQFFEPYGQRTDGDFGIYPVPAGTPVPKDVSPAETNSSQDLIPSTQSPNVGEPSSEAELEENNQVPLLPLPTQET